MKKDAAMPKLTEKHHWDSVHEVERVLLDSAATKRGSDNGQTSLKRRVKRKMNELIGSSVFTRMSDYGDYLLWEVIFTRYLRDLKGAQVLEIGSAPGEFLVQFSKKYECIVYGADYSEVGVDVNRKLFSSHGIDPDNVIHADVFSDQFHEQYRGSFKTVISRGFIEHFTDVENAIEKHMNLLAEDGYLIVSIPNLRGINYFLTRIFNKELIPLHNLDIMRQEVFSTLFDRDDLDRLFCDYYGTFNFTLFYAKNDSLRQFVLNFLHKLQPLLNLIFRLILRDRGMETKFVSPALLFIGKKTSRASADS